jgi:hypothetical protein
MTRLGRCQPLYQEPAMTIIGQKNTDSSAFFFNEKTKAIINNVSKPNQKSAIDNFMVQKQDALNTSSPPPSFSAIIDKVTISQEAKAASSTVKGASQSQTEATKAAADNGPALILFADSRDSAFIQRAFGPFENEHYKLQQELRLKEGRDFVGLEMPEFMRYRYYMPPKWYTDVISAPMVALPQQDEHIPAVEGFNEEQALALIKEFHQAVGKSLSQAFDKLGVKENDWRGRGDVFNSPARSAKLREEMFKIMNGDPRIREVMSLLGVEV